MEKIKIGITHGDFNGVGYELILKTFEQEEMLSFCTPVIYGSPKTATYHRKALGYTTNFHVIDSADAARDGQVNMVNCFGDEEQKIEYGLPTPEAGAAAIVSLDRAVADLKAGKLDALVTTPLNNKTVALEDGGMFLGQTDRIERLTGEGKKALKLFVFNNLRMALVTDCMPVADMPANITKDAIAESLVALHNTLKRDFFIDNPRIAVLAFNPKANGKEEQEIIAPVVEELFKRGVRCVGPYAAAEFFEMGNHTRFDAILAMYYDQGVPAFKALAQNDGIIYSAGLPVIRTSPAIGVNYAVAGKNETDEQSFRQAIYTAVDVARNRRRFDDERSHPLKKQYFEKRDDSDKLKLDQEEKN